MIFTKTSKVQEILLATMPQWHFWFARPFKRLLDEGVSLEMYYCLQILRLKGDTVTMSELAATVGMPKQQMTKMVDRLTEHNFVERVSDPVDRRIIRLKITENALEYIDRFLDKDAVYFKEFFDAMDEETRNSFGEALKTIHGTLLKLPGDKIPRHRCTKCHGHIDNKCDSGNDKADE